MTQKLKNDYFKFYKTKKFYQFTNLLVVRLFLSRLSSIKKKQGARICDLGCGRTDNFNFFSFLKFKYYGVETSLNTVKFLNKINKCNNFYLGTNDETPFKKNYFDFLISIHSFYYLKNQKLTIKDHLNEAKRILKKGGIFIVTFPKKDYANYQVIKFKNIFKFKNDKFKIRENSFADIPYGKKEIKKVFEKDFKILDIGFLDYSLTGLSERHNWCVLKKK